MRTAPIIITIVAVVATAFTAVSAEEYFVIRDKDGKVAVTSDAPGYGWSVDEGPFGTQDAAIRAAGEGPRVRIRPAIPQTVSKGRAQRFYSIRDRDGEVAITSEKPSYGWSVSQGPFASHDEAVRAVGKGADFPISRVFPQTSRDTGKRSYYVIQNRDGQRAVTSQKPNYGWSRVQGPFTSRDQAVRSTGVTLDFSQIPSSLR